MKDSNNRTIKYMRLSITDMCNFRCSYCIPEDAKTSFHKLSINDIKIIASNLNKLGIEKVKLTGGEPLVRDDVADIVYTLKNECNIKEVTLTTNGALLHKHLDALEQAKLDGITISIDTIQKDDFKELVKRNEYEQVINNIILARNSSIKNIKLNCVPLKQFGDENIISMCNFARELNIPIRFIEMMPIGLGRNFPGYNYNELISCLKQKYGSYKPTSTTKGNGPAHYLKFEQLDIDIGIISAISNKFCENCNRIRVTSTGKLKQCLHYNYNINLLEILQTDNGLETIKSFILAKPKEHSFKDYKNIKNIETLNMSDIGG